MTRHVVSLGLHQGESWAWGKAHMLLNHLSLSSGPPCLLVPARAASLHWEQCSLWGALLARACVSFLSSAEGEALIGLVIVGLCSELLFCKKGSCEATHAEGFSPSPEEKQQFRLWKSPTGTAYRGSKGESAGRRGRRVVDLPFPAYHDAWSLRSRQKGWEVAEPG